MSTADGIQYLYDFRPGTMHLAKLVRSLEYQGYQLGVARNGQEPFDTAYAKPL
jgi:hypothetical protein